MSAPIASFVMPCRDAASTVEAAVASIRAQSRTDWELVVVDDGSRDDTPQRVAIAARGDPRVRLVRRGRDGLVAALNAGVREARAPWIARMDADDHSRPERLARQVHRALADPGLAVVGCRVAIVPEEGVTDGMRHYLAWLNGLGTDEEIRRDLYVESPFVHPSVLIRADALRGVGGYRDGPFPEDYDLWLRMDAAGHRMAKVPEVLLDWRDGPGRLTRTDPRYAPEAFRTLKAEALAGTFLRAAREAQIWGAGPDGRKWRRTLVAAGIPVRRFFDIDPRKVGRRLAGDVPVLDWRQVPDFRGCPLLVAVGVKGAREQVRAALKAFGWVETVDFRCVQ